MYEHLWASKIYLEILNYLEGVSFIIAAPLLFTNSLDLSSIASILHSKIHYTVSQTILPTDTTTKNSFVRNILHSTTHYQVLQLTLPKDTAAKISLCGIN